MTVIKKNVNQKPECVSAEHKLACEIANCVTDETIGDMNGIIKRELGKYPVEHEVFDVLCRQSTFEYSSGAFVNADITVIDAVLVPSIFKCTGVMLTDTMVTAVKEELLLAGRIDRTYCIDYDYELRIDTDEKNIEDDDIDYMVAEYTNDIMDGIAEKLKNDSVKTCGKVEIVFRLYKFECICTALMNNDCATPMSVNLRLSLLNQCDLKQSEIK